MILLSVLVGLAATHDPLPHAAGPRSLPPEPGLVLERGAELPTLCIPREEELVFDVLLDLGLLGETRVGGVVLSAGVDIWRPGSVQRGGEHALATGPITGAEYGWLESRARGSYLGYVLDHRLSAQHLPQAWPAVVYRDTQTGSEHRRRELKLGLGAGVDDGSWSAQFRTDGHCRGCERDVHVVGPTFPWSSPRHCAKCKRGEHRTWREPRARPVPEGTVDLLTAVYLARSMLDEGREEVHFPVVDRRDLWTVTLELGECARVRTRAGAFDCRAVTLRAEELVTEESSADQAPSSRGFRGLFGIHGAVTIWIQEDTGVPVVIEGAVPVGPFELDVAVRLVSHAGTPLAFGDLVGQAD